jgi:glycosyltransferase involved in cell wall biosynthesis
MRVVHFHRKPNHIVFSIETLFDDIRSQLPTDIDVEVHVCTYPSKGIWRRLYESIRAAWHQGDINHITGDVHYLTYFLRKPTTILTIHDCGSLERLKGLRYWILWLFWYWLPSKRCAVITVISESTKKELLRHLGQTNCRIEVIPDCVTPEFHYHPKEFDSTCPRILQIGTKKNKNIERVATALQEIRCKLVIIGQLSQEQTDVLESTKTDYECLVGLSRQEVFEQYIKADIVMFASLYEGFGLPILEANVVGRPVISSNLYSMPEVGGDAACFVDPYSVDSIRDAVKKCIQDADYRNLLINNGLTNVKRFSAEAVAQRYAELYRRIWSKR